MAPRSCSVGVGAAQESTQLRLGDHHRRLGLADPLLALEHVEANPIQVNHGFAAAVHGFFDAREHAQFGLVVLVDVGFLDLVDEANLHRLGV